MAYDKLQDRMYMMPVHFGPCITPRQNKEGERFIYDQPGNLVNHVIVYETDPEKVSRLLPEGFSLTAPYVIVNMCMLRNLAWLAGRGYNLLAVNFPVEFKGKQESVKGDFVSVMWENQADPILTGRDQLGYNKIYASIEDIFTYNGVSKTSSSSWDFKFCEMEFDFNDPPENTEELKSILFDSEKQGKLHLKYIPSTGDGFCRADACYTTLAPSKSELPADVESLPPETIQYGSAQISWHRPTWEQMPTQHRIVQAFHELDIKRIIGGVCVSSHSLHDLYNTRKVL
jgi:hypothetical protein